MTNDPELLREALEYYTPERTARKHAKGQAVIKAAQKYLELLPLLEEIAQEHKMMLETVTTGRTAKIAEIMGGVDE